MEKVGLQTTKTRPIIAATHIQDNRADDADNNESKSKGRFNQR